MQISPKHGNIYRKFIGVLADFHPWENPFLWVLASKGLDFSLKQFTSRLKSKSVFKSCNYSWKSISQ